MLLFIFVFKEIILKLKKTKSFFFKTKRIKIYIINKYLWLANNNNNDNKFFLQFVSIKLFFIKSLAYSFFTISSTINLNFVGLEF